MLGLEPMAPIRPQLLVSDANHSATETSMYVCMYVCIDVCIYVCMYVCMYVLSEQAVGTHSSYQLGSLSRTVC